SLPFRPSPRSGEIAELVAFLLRPSQASVKGATFDVNGGSYIR
ncbi:SDR family NAD(P)-dependent oxidoreductase, partial [Rhizobium ruizarguesonis]